MAERSVAARVIVLAVGVLAGVGVWLATRAAPTSDIRAAQTATTTPQPAAAADGLPPSRPTRRHRAPLPAKEAPLSSIAAELEARASAGDTRAACRLAVELLRCAEIEEFSTYLKRQGPSDQPERPIASDADLAWAERSANEDIWRIRQQEQCDLLPRSLRDQAWSRLRAAALAGESEAMLRYASSAQIGMGMDNAFLAHPGFDDWRREAPPMVQRLFRSGDEDAALLLMLSSMGDMDPLSGLMGGDRHVSLAYRLLFWKMRADAPPPPPTSTYTAIEVERAMRQAEAWHRDHFGNRLRPRRTDYGKIAPLSMLDTNGPAPCET